MKKILKYIFSLSLSLLLFISGMGYSVNSMRCSKSGKTYISFSDKTGCCKKKETGHCRVKKKCCEISNKSFQLSNYTLSGVSQPVLESTLLLPDFRTACFSSEKPLLFSIVDDTSPPLSGIQLLHYIHILTI